MPSFPPQRSLFKHFFKNMFLFGTLTLTKITQNNLHVLQYQQAMFNADILLAIPSRSCQVMAFLF